LLIYIIPVLLANIDSLISLVSSTRLYAKQCSAFNLCNSFLLQDVIAIHRYLYRIFVRRFFQPEELRKFLPKNTQLFSTPFNSNARTTTCCNLMLFIYFFSRFSWRVMLFHQFPCCSSLWTTSHQFSWFVLL